jgi:hypothetical protein
MMIDTLRCNWKYSVLRELWREMMHVRAHQIQISFSSIRFLYSSVSKTYKRMISVGCGPWIVLLSNT